VPDFATGVGHSPTYDPPRRPEATSRRAVLAGLALALAGCGAGDRRQAVTGTVSYKGEPVRAGTVQFLTDTGPQGGAVIRDGRFEVPAAHGLLPGTYKVSVSAPGPVAVQTPEEKAAGASARATELLPARYNAATTLTAEVGEGRPNHFDFPLD
jgi:hypothetical protein